LDQRDVIHEFLLRRFQSAIPQVELLQQELDLQLAAVLARKLAQQLVVILARKLARQLVVKLAQQLVVILARKLARAYARCLVAESPRSDMKLVYPKQSPLVARQVVVVWVDPLDRMTSRPKLEPPNLLQ
jgi:hypothetical protein